MDTTAETLVGRDDDEELALAGLLSTGVREDLWRDARRLVYAAFEAKMRVDTPVLATPYCLPACIARYAFESFVDAIIFMD